MLDTSCIGVKEILPFAELEARLRDAVLVGMPDVRIYRDAEITAEAFKPEALNLTTAYLLSGNLEFQERLRERLLGFGIDTFRMRGMAILETPGGDAPIAPPIVEHAYLPFLHPDQPERGPVRLSLDALIDGVHRCELARRAGERISCAYVFGADERFWVPIVPNGWDELRTYDAAPLKELKKRYLSRSTDNYRDFSGLGSNGYRRP